MKLSFRNPYLSITSLPECDLPKFTVLTGVNGSGKTHLMQAILNGHIAVSAISDHCTDVRYYDWNSLVPNNGGNYDSHGRSQSLYNAYNGFRSSRESHKQQLVSAAHHHKLSDFGIDWKEAAGLSTDQLAAKLGDTSRARQIREHLDAVLNAIWANIESSLTTPPPQAISPQRKAIQSLRSSHFYRLFDINEHRFSSALDPVWGNSEPFQQAFAQLFGSYRDLLVENRLAKLALAEGDAESQPLSDEEFKAKYNEPPWEFVNRTLADAGLDFSINVPRLNSFGPYTPLLRKRSSSQEMDFSSLSSGEKVLMAFALCVYYAQDRRQISKFPPLLLLDEVDATLHPSMCRQLLRTITETLITSCGIHVILATHSPTTVALAPEASVHIMNGPRGISKTSKNAALNVLTEGVPTVSLDFGGRRQVIVESSHDACVYDAVYRLVKSRISSERSLEFIGVGQNPSANSGCDQVIHVVSSLCQAGSTTVFGLVDWDRKHNEGERLVVLAPGTRYSLENCVFDPLLVAIAVTRLAPSFLPSRGLKQVANYLWFKDKDHTSLQPIVDAIADWTFPGTAGAAEAHILYIGNLELKVRADYLTTQGHELEGN